MTDLLLIGASGAKAYRTALGAVAENIANADDPAYTRRSVALTEADIAPFVSPYYVNNPVFSGVRVAGVTRAADPFVDLGLRGAISQSGGTAARLKSLSALETALGDGDDGIGAKISAFFAAGERLAASPDNAPLRTDFIARLEEATLVFKNTAVRLQDVSDLNVGEAGATVDVVNSKLQELTQINRELLGARPESAGQAQLLDRRDAALFAITERLPMQITFNQFGQAGLTYDGQTVLDNATAGSFALAANADGTFGLTFNGSAVTTPGSGSLSGMSAAATVLATRRSELDGIAETFATNINSWQAGGRTPAGTAGPALLTVGGGAAGITMATSAIADIAAATAGGAANGNLLALSAVRTAAGGGEREWQSLVQGVAISVQSARTEDDVAAAQTDYARERRDRVSAVDLDREATDLIRLQQAYDASARVLQVARETMQSIFNIF